ncbi:MAG: glycosyl hydrolase 53 family protein [Bacteroidota bacterium]
MTQIHYLAILLLFFLFNSCQHQETQVLYLGADLSYVNEMEDCGGTYRLNGKVADPYWIFSQKGTNIVRLRLWHTPEWSGYSDLKDVTESIRRSKAAGMAVLLDFHYSDFWADPQKQIIPKAWEPVVDDLEALGDSMYNYTRDVLIALAEKSLAPEFVQVGNEINIEILQEKDSMLLDRINWPRNVELLNHGIQAVRDVTMEKELDTQVMLHIAQPEFAIPWLKDAARHNIQKYDWIGLSYYPKWSEYEMDEVGPTIDSVKTMFDTRVMLVETAYPYTMLNVDSSGNILWKDSLAPGYPATPEGQLNFMVDLTKAVISGGGEGVIYWEPGWISTGCSTPWATGSAWDNATFFDGSNQNEALPVFNFLTYDYHAN